MYVLWRVVVKELLQIRRDRRMIPVIFVAPVVMITIFGFAVNTDVTHVPLVLVDQDRSAASRDLVSRFLRSGYFEIVGSEERAEDVDRWLVTSRAQLGLVIAPDFGAALDSGRTARLQVITDGSDASSASVALGYAGALASALRRRDPGLSAPPRGAGARRLARGRSSSCHASSTTPTSRAAGSTCPRCWRWC